jgi:hypothetical protein
MGRRAHVTDQTKFSEFMSGVPEEFQNAGYWSVYKDAMGKSGGVVRQGCGFIPFDPTDDYEGLRKKIFSAFIEKEDGKGPGDYNAIPCDQNKKELKGQPIVKFRFTERECPMPESTHDINPIGDTLKTVKKMTSDMAALQSIELQQKLLNKFIGNDKKEDESLKDATNVPAGTGFTDFLLWQNFINDSRKKESVDPAIAQQLSELKMERLISEKIEKAIGELKNVVQPKGDDNIEKIFEKMQENQNRFFEKVLEIAKPRDESKVERLLEQVALSKQENAFQTFLAIMMKQQEEREKVRMEEERRREEERKEERLRLEEERREERRRIEEQLRLEREKFEAELKERQRRFDEEAKLRREEMKRDEEKARMLANEQQKFQLELLNIFKNNKDSNLETTSKIVEVLTTAGMNSMKTSQDAAETIMQIAKTAGLGKERDKDDKGFVEHIKDIAQIAVPFIAPYADADAKLKVLQAASKMPAKNPGLAAAPTAKRRDLPPPKPTPKIVTNDASANGDSGLAGFSKSEIDAAIAMAAQYGFSRADVEKALSELSKSGISKKDIEAAMSQLEGGSQAQEAAPPSQTYTTSTTASSGATPVASAGSSSYSKDTIYGGARSMIAQYLKAYPILKHALIGNLRDKIGVRAFLPVVTGLNQPTLEGLLANLPHQVVMGEIKQVCSDDEVKLIDENEDWFIKFRKEMIEILKEAEEEEEEEKTSVSGSSSN